MGKKTISKEDLYQSVKMLVESSDKHIHLHQHKLFTLFSIAFQYLLYVSTKQPGYYVIRIEDSFLAEKLARKAKDDSSRKFLERLIIQRKLRYGNSTFVLDYFHINTWALINELPHERIKSALIVKDTVCRPMSNGSGPYDDKTESVNEISSEGDSYQAVLAPFGKTYYLTSLQNFVPKTIIIAFENNFENTTKMAFPFIKEQDKKIVNGVTLAGHVNVDELD